MAARSGKSARRTQEDRSSATREALIKAAIDSIYEIGYVASTVDRIAKRANVSRGAVRHHFNSRDDFVPAIIDASLSRLDFAFDTVELSRRPLEERIAALVEQYRGIYTRKSFIVTISIWLGTTTEPALIERLHRHAMNIQAALDQHWLDAFPDIDISKDQLISLRHMIFAAIADYSLQERMGLMSDWQKDSRTLCAMAYAYLSTFKQSVAQKRDGITD